MSAPAANGRTYSLQTRLMTTLLGLVTLVWVATLLATWMDTEHEVGELLDAHLAQAASVLVTQPLEDLGRLNLSPPPNLHDYQPKVVLQVWHLNDLVVRSPNAPDVPLAESREPGFSERTLEGERWRVFTVEGKDHHVIIHVAEQEKARYDVVLASLRSVVWPMVLGLPLLTLGVWWAVRHVVQPLNTLGQQVAHRRPDEYEALPLAGTPQEAQSLVLALNRLLEQTASLLHAERRFTADASHELRTPIAAIRMQAQVAQGAQNDTERQEALAATLQGCDRATRLVTQLLQLARLEADSDSDTGTSHPSAVLPCLQRVQGDLSTQAAARQQRLVLQAADATLRCPAPEALTQVLVRNLLDNALRYSPDGSEVRVALERSSGQRARLTVEDSGPGLSDADAARLGERFFRVLGSGQPGSGLGWSIVQRIANLYHLTVLVDRSPSLHGLRVTLTWTMVAPSADRSG